MSVHGAERHSCPACVPDVAPRLPLWFVSDLGVEWVGVAYLIAKDDELMLRLAFRDQSTVGGVLKDVLSSDDPNMLRMFTLAYGQPSDPAPQRPDIDELELPSTLGLRLFGPRVPEAITFYAVPLERETTP